MKVNRIIAGIMAMCVMGFGVPYVNTVAENNSVITASAEEETDYTKGTYEQLTYKNYGDYIEISDCDKKAETVVIPAEIDGIPVTSIGNGAFWCCSSLKSIEIPDSVTNIGRWVFEGTLWLESKQAENPLVIVNNILIDGTTCSGDVVIPDDITSIGHSAFEECKSLTSVKLPDSVTNIGKFAFSDCISLTSINIPENVTNIGDYAFNGCKSLESINIPDSVISIGDSTFSFCRSLTSINIPDSVTSIGRSAFYGCSNLTSITILNPDCNIAVYCSTIAHGMYDEYNYYFYGTIYGYEDSTAQAYAEKYGRKFVSLGKAPEKETATGDMNGDNSVNIADAVFLQNCILGRQELTEEQFKNADLTGDGFVDSFDMVLLRRMIIENIK